MTNKKLLFDDLTHEELMEFGVVSHLNGFHYAARTNILTNPIEFHHSSAFPCPACAANITNVDAEANEPIIYEWALRVTWGKDKMRHIRQPDGSWVEVDLNCKKIEK